MPENPSGSSPDRARRPLLLSSSQRTVIGLSGGLFSAAGVAATFVTSNQAGATALLALGGLGGLMAVTGRIPDRIGREGIVHERDDEPASEVLVEILEDDDFPQSLKDHVAEMIDDRLRTAPVPTVESDAPAPDLGRPSQRLNSQARFIRFERTALDLLAAALPPTHRLRDARGIARTLGSPRFDAYIVPADASSAASSIPPRAIAVEIKTYARLNGFYDAMRHVESGFESLGLTGCVLITDESAPVPTDVSSRYPTLRVLRTPPDHATPNEHAAALQSWRMQVESLLTKDTP